MKYEHAPIAELLEAIDVPPSAYEKAEARYKSVYKWLASADAKSSLYSPHVYSQGSFRLGTVIKPVAEDGDYDLDLGCRLRSGIYKTTHTQKDLKTLVRDDLEKYRETNGIIAPLEEKHRCWRLQYADEMNFHMDVVPSIPEEIEKRGMLKRAMLTEGFDEGLAQDVSDHAGAITDNSSDNYDRIDPDWRISNSEGYALWFESRMRLAEILLEKKAEARLDEIPAHDWKSPLQRVVQLLKWHRDQMYKDDPAAKPISVIITTLAAQAYNGEASVEEALENVLGKMGNLVRESEPRVPNPINPENEDFADKWSNPDYAELNLESNFWTWLEKAKEHFSTIATTSDPILFEKVASESFGVSLPGTADGLKRQKKQTLLFEKADQIAKGARTNSAGIIGATGVSNAPHKFYGEETVHPEEEA